jgi:hypothetical protein
MKYTISRIAAALVIAVALPAFLFAQGQRAAQPATVVATAKSNAPVDLTGYWVSIVSEDWRIRMITPQKGDYPGIPINAAARRIADAWDPAKDEAADAFCKGYAAPHIVREPGRFHITWENDNTLRIDIDSGTQTRLFHFGKPQPPGERTWQGYSVAQWEPVSPARRGAKSDHGSLKVVTTNLRAGYVRKNGVPFSEDALLEEFYDVIKDPDGVPWLIVTTKFTDPTYLTQPFIFSTHFKKEPDGSKWNPTPCAAR